MDWYKDPTGVAQKVVAALGAVVALASAVPDVLQGQASAETLTGPIGILVSTGLAIWAIRQARKEAFKPETVGVLEVEANASGYRRGYNRAAGDGPPN